MTEKAKNLNKRFEGKCPCKFCADQDGFTLIEMMIALAITLLVMSGVYEVFTSQQKAYSIQDQVAEMQQNARVAMDMMTRSIRMAGYDPEDNNIFGITDSAYSNSNSGALLLSDITDPLPNYLKEIHLTIDNDGDGNIDASDTNEEIGFRLNGTDLEIDLRGGGWQPLAENITALTFTYTFADGGSGLPDNTDGDNTNDFEDIRIVQISVTARTTRQDSAYTHPTAGDGYRRRTLTANVRPRNFGL